MNSPLFFRVLALFLSLMLLSSLGVGFLSVSAKPVTDLSVENVFYESVPSGYGESVIGLSDAEFERFVQAVITASHTFNEDDPETPEDESTSFTVDISSFSLAPTQENADAIGYIIFKDIPEILYCTGVGYSYYEGEPLATVTVRTEHFHEKDYADMMEVCEEKAEEFLADIKDADLTDIQKALILHDRLLVNTSYDYENYLAHQVPPAGYSMYSALNGDPTVCEGYTRAYMFLLQKIGISSYFCNSDMMGHGWNIVLIGTERYHVDLTFDDPISDKTPEYPGYAEHSCFMVSSRKLYDEGHYFTAEDGNAYFDYDPTLDDTTYDDFFWNKSESAFCYLKGKIYFMDNKSGMLKEWKKDDTKANVKKLSTLTRLQEYSGGLLYNTDKQIRWYDPETGKDVLLYAPKEDVVILGCHEKNGYLTLRYAEEKKQEYIVTMKMPPFPGDVLLIGDVDRNNSVENTDRTMLARYLAEWGGDYDKIDMTAADVDGNKSVENTDRTILARYLAEWHGEYDTYFAE